MWTPRTATSPGCQTPEMITAASTPARKSRLCAPSMPRALGTLRPATPGPAAALAARVDESTRQVDREHQAAPRRTSRTPQAESPEERHPAQEPEEERRVAERRQRAADVRHQEDEEDHGMGLVPAISVGAQQRPDQDHGGAGRADPGGEKRAHGEDGKVYPRRTAQRSPDVDAAADRKQGAEEDQEREVVRERDVEDLVNRRAPVRQDERDGQQQSPDERDLRVIVVPEAGRQQREESDREQDPCERKSAPDGKLCTQVGHRAGILS